MKDAASTNHFGNRRSFIGGSDARIIMGTDRPAQFSAFTSGATPQTLDVNSPLPATMDRTGTAINPRTQLAAAIAKLNEFARPFSPINIPISSRRKG
jgi:hypothetical protein